MPKECIKQEECKTKPTDEKERYINPSDISVPPGYQVDVFITGLDTPSSICFTDEGELIIAESGIVSLKPQIILFRNGEFHILSTEFNPPISGASFIKGKIYVAHKGTISILHMDGSKEDILLGLPSFGDYSNGKISLGPDGKIYFGQGTATNSGVVGVDNKWVFTNPYFHDTPGSYVMLNGQNFKTPNILAPSDTAAYTGAFAPFGMPYITQYGITEGATRASGSVLKANPDGSDLELVAWGFRNPSHVKFDRFNRLFVSNQGYENRGSRPVVNAPDEMQLMIPHTWYGWPDYAGGEPLTLPRFQPESGSKLEFLLTNHPSVPPKPFAIFPSGSNIMGFDFNPFPSFGTIGDAYLANFGNFPYDKSGNMIISSTGFRISKIDMSSGEVSTFAINKSGFPSYKHDEGGFGRPCDVAFGPDNAMYILDFSATSNDFNNYFIPNTGLIWRISNTI